MQEEQQEFLLKFGEGQQKVCLSAADVLAVVAGRETAGITDPAAACRMALKLPYGAPSLKELPWGGKPVVIVVSDITRRWMRYEEFLPVLLDELNACGVCDSNITLLVALGAHRSHDLQEQVQVYGAEAVKRVRIVQSQAEADDDFVTLGTTSRGVPIKVHRLVAQGSNVILTGAVGYHSMAGFSGGRKAVLPGVSAWDSIQANHRLCLHHQPGKGLNPACDAGSLKTNDMHLDMLEIASAVQPAFLLNTVYTPAGDFAGFFAGHWLTAWQAGCRKVEEIYGVPVAHKAEMVIVSAGGYPQDINFYQASKAIENAAMALKPGGVMIAVAECRDISEPPEFSGWFNWRIIEERERALRSNFTVPGFVALKLGKLAQEFTIIMVSLPQNSSFFADIGLQTAVNVQEAVRMGQKVLKTAAPRIIIMPQGTATLPILR